MGQSELINIIRKLSYREGDFTLASGQRSSFYIDLKNTSLDPEGIQLIAKFAFEALQGSGWSIDGVGGPTLGADPIATALSIEAYRSGLNWPAFIVRKEPKKHGTSKYVEGIQNLKPGASVVVLEDVVTTGGSSIKAIEKLKMDGLNPVGVLTIVDREAGAKEAYEKHDLPFISLCRISDFWE